MKLQIRNEIGILRLSYFEVLSCEGHLEEKGAKIVNEKEQGKESYEYTSNIRNNINNFQEASIVGSCQRRSLDVQKGFGNRIILIVNNSLKRFTFDPFLGF